jgi:hypothetical protein
MALAQIPFRGPATGPPGAADNSFYNGGAPAATFQQPRREQQDDDPPPRGDQPVITGELFEPGEVLAVVGDQYILAADVLPHVNQVLEPFLDKVPPQQINEQRRLLTAQLTAAHIEVKTLYLAFLRKAPADKVKDILKKVDADFDKTLEKTRQDVQKKTKDEYQEVMRQNSQIGRLALLMKEANVWEPGELDILLRKYGGSLAQEKSYYAEYTLGRAMVFQSMNSNPNVSHDEMLRYYQEHQKDYLIPTRVRFEILSSRFANFPDKQRAMDAICAMGNEVFYGANLAAVARRSSQGLNAEQGGYNDWTNRGSLASKRLDEALFSLEPGKLSQVIEDERGYHILRVLERAEAGKVPFGEVQISIRDKIKQEKLSKQYKEVAVKFRESSKVWTVFDDDPHLAKAAGRGDTKRR